MATTADAFAMACRYHAEGDLSLAEQFSWSILSEEPNHAGALQLLGLIAKTRGEAGQALDYLNRSLICDGANADTWRHLGDMHESVGNFRAAVANYEQALRLRPDFGEAYNNLGIALQRVGEWVRAEACHREALRLMPSSATAHNDLANALRGQRKLAQAVAAFQRALELEPGNPIIAYNVGTTLHDQGELDRAIGFYRRALCQKPEFAEASNNLARAFKEQGFLDEAVAQFHETLKLKPDHALAYYNLGEIAAAGLYQFTSDELARIKAMITAERYSAFERSLCSFALASELNKHGRYDEAFGYYEEANDLRRRVLRESHVAFDAQGHEARIDRIMADQDQAFFARVRGWGVATDLPVFIVGMPRSGSTLVEQILASHHRVLGAGELGEVPEFFTNWAAQAGRGLVATSMLADQSTAQDLAANYLKHIADLGAGADRVTIKNLENYVHLGVIATLFPNARIIHCRRDPLDTCLSCYFQNFDDMVFAWSLEDIGTCYRAYDKLMGHWSRVLPLKIHEICYEDLVRNQETVTRHLLAYCGLSWDERCLTFFKTRRVVRTASTVQVRKPISAQAIGRWKHYRSHLDPLFQALGQPVPTAAPLEGGRTDVARPSGSTEPGPAHRGQ